jgi:superfamily II DNA/RNA helicase
LGYVKPSPIQTATIPIGLQAKNIIAQSKSGTGKTISFLSIIFGRLLRVPAESAESAESEKPDKNFLRAMIALPTRELTNQVFQQALKINNFLPADKKIAIRSVMGGLPINEDLQFFKRKSAELVIGTSGRINELLKRNAFHLDQLDMFVMDEADILIKMGDFNRLFHRVTAKKRETPVQ